MIKTPKTPKLPTFQDAIVIETTNSERNYALVATGDKCLVREDVFKTGKECQRCQGKAYSKTERAEVNVGSLTGIAGVITTIQCPRCKGHGVEVEEKLMPNHSKRYDEKGACPDCDGRGYITCPDCHGRGVQHGTIITPESAQQRTSTGIIISMGPLFGKLVATGTGDVITLQTFQVGDRVSYSNYGGTLVQLEQKVKLLFLREHEILGKCYVLKKDNTTVIDSTTNEGQAAMATTEGR